MIVVSDASPILALVAVARLSLLEKLYAQVIVPEAVLAELSVIVAENPDFEAVPPAPWIEVRRARVRSFFEALLLKRGRRMAARLGLKVTGLLGVLAEAKHAGFAHVGEARG